MGLAVFNLIGTNSLATEGLQLDQIHEQISELEKVNQETQIEISQVTNLARLQSQAENQGYRHAQEVYHVNAGAIVALSTR